MPLVHDTALLQFEMPPFVCLRVRGIASQVQPARNGPILAHCGGPLTGRECAQDMSEVSFLDIDGQHEIISHFDLISIDQRGVLSTQDTYERQGKWGVPPPCPFEESGQALKPFPEVYCDEAAKHNLGSVKQVLEQLVTVGHNQSMEELARTYVLPIYLNRGIPVSVLTEGNESFVRWYYRLVRLEHSLCFEAPRYKIQAPNGRMYNTLQFAGTIDLAYDIEAWQKKMHLSIFFSFTASCVFPTPRTPSHLSSLSPHLRTYCDRPSVQRGCHCTESPMAHQWPGSMPPSSRSTPIGWSWMVPCTQPLTRLCAVRVLPSLRNPFGMALSATVRHCIW